MPGGYIIKFNIKKISIQSYLPRTIVIFLLFLSLLACSLGPSRKEIVKEYEKASNAHQIDSLVALFSDNAQIEFVGMSPAFVGKESLAGKARYDSTLNDQITLTINRIKRDTAYAIANEKNLWLSQAGLTHGATLSMAFVIKKGKITALRAEMSDSSLRIINDTMSSLIPWAQQYQPEKLSRLMTNGAFVYGAESARLSLTLLNEWASQRSAR